MGWKPLLRGDLADAALLRAERLSAAVLERSVDEAGAAELAERAMLRVHLAALRPGRGHEELALREARAAHEVLQRSGLPLDLHGGRAGITWLIDQVYEILGDQSGPRACDELDRELYAVLAGAPWRGEHDLISGLAGFGLHALSGSRVQTLQHVLEGLAQLARPQVIGVAWYTPAASLAPAASEKFPEGVFDLGVAHGVAGVIAVLAEAEAAGVRERRTAELLDGAVEWLLAHRLPRDDLGGFAQWVYGEVAIPAARSAWCYGAPGISAVLLRAARHRGEPRWEAEALDIARAAARRPASEARVRDAAVCHGACGLGHIFGRLYAATGDPLFERTAVEWFQRALELPDGEDVSLLSGWTGIALALLSAAGGVEPRWDRWLLLDL